VAKAPRRRLSGVGRPPRRRPRARRAGASTPRSGTPRPRPANGHTDRSASHGSVFGVDADGRGDGVHRPAAAASGTGRFRAHTPSVLALRRPRAARRAAARSTRSMPRVGTEMTSGRERVRPAARRAAPAAPRRVRLHGWTDGDGALLRRSERRQWGVLDVGPAERVAGLSVSSSGVPGRHRERSRAPASRRPDSPGAPAATRPERRCRRTAHPGSPSARAGA